MSPVDDRFQFLGVLIISSAPRFVLLEPSLRSVGGHYLQYAVQILTAAEQAGFQPVLVSHRRLPESVTFPPAWRVYRAFPHIVGGIHRVAQESHAGTKSNLISYGRQVTDAIKATFGHLRFWRNRSRIRGFAKACHQVFTNEILAFGDIVHCATATDTEVLGLVEFLRSSAESQVAEWHMQFHFRIFRGRDPEFAAQRGRAIRIEQRLAEALALVPHHRMFFHATTETLARQLRWIKLHDVDCLPWPVRIPTSQPTALPSRPTPIRSTASAQDPQRYRIVVAGAARPEKGTSSLFALSPLAARAQLILQVPRRDKQQWTWLRRSSQHHHIAVCDSVNELNRPEFLSADILCVPHPLPSDQYYQLILNADIGLLPYHADEYFARCSGVLIEFLSAGVPVIGPAGCWLGDQIEQQNQSYFQRLWTSSGMTTGYAPTAFPDLLLASPDTQAHVTQAGHPNKTPSTWKVCLDRPFQEVDRSGVKLRIDINPAVAQDILLRIDGLGNAEPGIYLRAHLEFDACQEEPRVPHSSHLFGYVSRHESLESMVSQDTATFLLLAWNPSATPRNHSLMNTMPSRSISKPMTNAAGGGSVSLVLRPLVDKLDIPLSLGITGIATIATQGHLPRGDNGLTFAGQEDIYMSLLEMIGNYSHYLAAAREGAAEWRRRHDPHQTILKLTQRRMKWI